MPTESESTPISVAYHGPFFRDAFFASAWHIIEKHQTNYENKCHIEHNKFSVEKNLPFRSAVISSPTVDTSKSGSDINVLSEEKEFGAEKDNYQVILDVQQFQPAEISVYQADGHVSVEGKHEEKHDPKHKGLISRQFKRNYKLPADVEVLDIQCNLSSDGILQIILPRMFAKVGDLAHEDGIGEKTANENGSVHAELPDSETMMQKINHNYLQPVIRALPDMLPFWHRIFGTSSKDYGIHSDKDYFKILVDVRGFGMDDIIVECTDFFIQVVGKHGDKNDVHGSISRQFISKYDLPRCVQPADIESHLLPGGILEIMAPKMMSSYVVEQSRRTIPVRITWEAEQEICEELKKNAGSLCDDLNAASLN